MRFEPVRVYETYEDVLKVLEENDGACLIWQMPDGARLSGAITAGVVKLDGDLAIHPKATKVDDGCYTMNS